MEKEQYPKFGKACKTVRLRRADVMVIETIKKTKEKSTPPPKKYPNSLCVLDMGVIAASSISHLELARPQVRMLVVLGSRLGFGTLSKKCLVYLMTPGLGYIPGDVTIDAFQFEPI